MTTARDIIKNALQLGGVITKNESPTGDEYDDALFTLNAMLSSWSNEALLTYYQEQESFPLTSGVGAYTIGTGATFNTAKPIKIVTAFARLADIDYDLTIITGTDFDEYITQKNLTGVPEYLFFDNNYPVATIKIWPIPTSTYTLFIRSEKELTQFPTLDTDVILPPGWELALYTNLSSLIMPTYGQPVNPKVEDMALNSLGAIKLAVAKNKSMDAQPLSNYNDNDILGGSWYY